MLTCLVAEIHLPCLIVINIIPNLQTRCRDTRIASFSTRIEMWIFVQIQPSLPLSNLKCSVFSSELQPLAVCPCCWICWIPWNLLRRGCGQMPSDSARGWAEFLSVLMAVHALAGFRSLYVLGGQGKEGGMSSPALHHMPNMSLPANVLGMLASARTAEFLTEGDE